MYNDNSKAMEIVSDIPKVYGNGDVTVCMSLSKFRLFLSQTEIRHIKYMSIEWNESVLSSVKISFTDSDDQEVKKEIEEYSRACKSYPFIKII